MFQYFISQIDINKINTNMIEKLKEKFQFNEIKENIFYSNEGYYVINDNKITLFKIIHKDNVKEEHYLDKYTLLGNHIYIKKIEDVMKLPVNYLPLTIEKIYFQTKGSSNNMILEKINNNICKIYFTSKDKKLNENNFFFNNDMSLYLKSLNI